MLEHLLNRPWYSADDFIGQRTDQTEPNWRPLVSVVVVTLTVYLKIAMVGRVNARWTTWKSGHPCPCQNCLQWLPVENDWKRIPAELSFVFPRRPNRTRDWTELNYTTLNWTGNYGGFLAGNYQSSARHCQINKWFSKIAFRAKRPKKCCYVWP